MIDCPVRFSEALARQRRSVPGVLRLLSCALICCVTSTAQAGASGRVAISVDGLNGDRLRTELVSALPAGIEVLDEAKLGPALSRQRIGNVSAALGAPRRRKAVIAKLHKIARALGVEAVIVGAVPVRRNKGGLEVQLVTVRTSQKGAVIDETVRFARGESRAARWRKLLGDALDDLRVGAAPVAVEEVKDEEETAKNDEEGKGSSAAESSREAGEGQERQEEQEGKQRKHAKGSKESAESEEAEEQGPTREGVSPANAFLVIFGGLDLGGRQFHYNQRLTNDTIRPFDLPQSALLPVSPGGALSAEFYPFATSSGTWARDVGVTAGGRYNLAKAKLGTTTLDTKWYSWDLNLRGRMFLGERGGSSPVVGLQAGLGQQVFAFKGATQTIDVLPGVNYRFLRIGADGRVPVGRVDVMVEAAFRHLLSNGDIVGKHFPNASIAGLDGKIGAAFQFTKGFEARVVLNYVRFWASLNPSLTGPRTYVAGGALEQMVNLDLGVAAFF